METFEKVSSLCYDNVTGEPPATMATRLPPELEAEILRHVIQPDFLDGGDSTLSSQPHLIGAYFQTIVTGNLAPLLHTSRRRQIRVSLVCKRWKYVTENWLNHWEIIRDLTGFIPSSQGVRQCLALTRQPKPSTGATTNFPAGASPNPHFTSYLAQNQSPNQNHNGDQSSQYRLDHFTITRSDALTGYSHPITTLRLTLGNEARFETLTPDIFESFLRHPEELQVLHITSTRTTIRPDFLQYLEEKMKKLTTLSLVVYDISSLPAVQPQPQPQPQNGAGVGNDDKPSPSSKRSSFHLPNLVNIFITVFSTTSHTPEEYELEWDFPALKNLSLECGSLLLCSSKRSNLLISNIINRFRSQIQTLRLPSWYAYAYGHTYPSRCTSQTDTPNNATQRSLPDTCLAASSTFWSDFPNLKLLSTDFLEWAVDIELSPAPEWHPIRHLVEITRADRWATSFTTLPMALSDPSISFSLPSPPSLPFSQTQSSSSSPSPSLSGLEKAIRSCPRLESVQLPKDWLSLRGIWHEGEKMTSNVIDLCESKGIGIIDGNGNKVPRPPPVIPGAPISYLNWGFC